MLGFPGGSVQFSSVTQSCPTLCNPMDCSMPGLPVHHPLPELAQTHVHQDSDASRQPSHPLSYSSPPASGSFPMSQFFSSGGVSASASVSPSNEYSGLISFRIYWFDLLAVQGTRKSLLQHQFKSISSLVLSFLYSPTLTSIYDYCKNHSFDQMDICVPSNVSAF